MVVRDGGAGVVAMEGKTACGFRDGQKRRWPRSAPLPRPALRLRQEHTRGKGNEIAAIKALMIRWP